jgi:hypothetical protein
LARRDSRAALVFLLRAGGARFYFDGKNWGELESACLYTRDGAWEAAKALRREKIKSTVCCVIQDRASNFFDGTWFVYSLSTAKVYTPESGSRKLAGLAGLTFAP